MLFPLSEGACKNGVTAPASFSAHLLPALSHELRKLPALALNTIPFPRFTEHETLHNGDFVSSLVNNSTLSLSDDLENVIPLILIIDEFWTSFFPFVLFAKAKVPISIKAKAKNTFFILIQFKLLKFQTP